ncbi:ABC transporter permease [Gordoniibacillus kamchatkensis]|uniref:ABC transporter permease n=1 Tax=Gordoniibacillus kamchatkensis TaxID=1590651 RepID=A0ABR5ABT2_9BACL|nr:sugar ABC transporter permease [Paenibacillus sp. VKM B-2647]KIL38420.1 ABC transporter permease [Paenibacillus sp. VKM B-2647]
MYTEKKLAENIKVFVMFAFVPLLAFLTVKVIPFAIGVTMTFTDWNGVASSFQFKGFENYIAAFRDAEFWHSMLFTVRYVVCSVVLTNVIAFALALLVSSGVKGQNAFRLGFFTPNLIGGIILGFIWQFIFSRVLVYVGKEAAWDLFANSWLAQPDKAFWALVIVGVWQTSGYMMLIYIAGLTGIPGSLLEAAGLDGASKWQQLIRIKIPLMVPAFTISLFLTLQKSFMVYDTNLSLTQGGPYRSTELIAMHVYNEAFLYQRYGSGQAKAVILFIIVALIAVIQVRAMKRLEVRS